MSEQKTPDPTQKTPESPQKPSDETENLKKQVEALTKQISIYKAREKNPKVAKAKALPAVQPAPEPHDHNAETPQKGDSPHQEGVPHYIGGWQKYCPECGDQNPDFKDETVCANPDCGMHLGAAASVEKLKACPNCGGHAAKAIK